MESLNPIRPARKLIALGTIGMLSAMGVSTLAYNYSTSQQPNPTYAIPSGSVTVTPDVSQTPTATRTPSSVPSSANTTPAKSTVSVAKPTESSTTANTKKQTTKTTVSKTTAPKSAPKPPPVVKPTTAPPPVTKPTTVAPPPAVKTSTAKPVVKPTTAPPPVTKPTTVAPPVTKTTAPKPPPPVVKKPATKPIYMLWSTPIRQTPGGKFVRFANVGSELQATGKTSNGWVETTSGWVSGVAITGDRSNVRIGVPTTKPKPEPKPPVVVQSPAVIEQVIFQCINDYRKRNGVAPLNRSVYMDSYARSWSSTMGNNRKLSHSSGPYGENVAFVTNAANVGQTLCDAWIGSSGHRYNLLQSKWRTTGVGVVYKNGAYYATQEFTR